MTSIGDDRSGGGGGEVIQDDASHAASRATQSMTTAGMVTEGNNETTSNISGRNKEDLSMWESSVLWLSSEVLDSPGKVFCIGSVAVLAGTYFGYKIPASTIEQISGGVKGVGMPPSRQPPHSSSSSSSSSSATAAATVAANKTTLSTVSTSTATTSAQSPASATANTPTAAVATGAGTTTTATTTVPYAELDAEARAQRHAVAVGTARRAFRYATVGTVGVFGLVGSIWFYVIQGYRSLDDAKKEWTTMGNSIRNNLESFMGGDTAPSKSHPDVVATKNMSEEQEMKYLYEKYIQTAVEEEYKRSD